MTNESLAKEALRLHIFMLGIVLKIHHGYFMNELCGIKSNMTIYPTEGMVNNLLKLHLVEISENKVIATRLGKCFSKAFIDNGQQIPFSEDIQIDKEFTK